MKCNWKSILVVICSTAGSLFSFGQDVEMNPIVVTGNLSAQRSRETGRNITIIRQEDIHNMPANSLDELLKFIPGIEVQQRGPQGAQSDIVIRGGTFQQVLVVIDGSRLNDPLTGHFNSYIPIHPSEIERIEILKGAASAVFGPDAVGGVIHIITKNFQRKYMEEGHSLQAQIQPGSMGMLNTSMRARVQGKKSFFSLGYQQQKADGPVLRGTNGFFNNRNIVLSTGKVFNRGWSVLLRGAVDRRAFNAQNFYTSFLSDTANEKVNSTWQQLLISHQKEKSRLDIIASGKQLEDTYYFRPSSIPNNNKTQIYSVQINNTYKLTDRTTWIAGVQSISKRIRSNDRGNHDHLHTGVFSILTHTLPSSIVLSESIRADWDQSYKWVLIPQLNIAWSPSKITLRSSIGRSIRDADFTERFNNYNKSLVTGGSIGNPSLNAEKAWNMEFGIDASITSSIEFKSTIFKRSQTNLIDWFPTAFADMPRRENLSPTGNFALASNIASVNTKGVEFDLFGVHQWNSKHRLRWNTGFVWLNSETPGGTAPSFYLSSHAKFMWSSSLHWSMKQTSISLSTLYKQRNPQSSGSFAVGVTPNYFLVNAKLEQKLIKGRTSLFVQIMNIGNIRYSDLLGSIMPGRWWSGGLIIDLQQVK
ncbi:MAG: TonB-dependent receptor plug domain-containing protein [bacterium]